MSRGSIKKYEGKNGHSWRLRIVTGYDERGYPIVRRHTQKGGTKREAEAKLCELLNEVDKGTYIQPSKLTLEEFIKKWFETHRQGISLTTERRYLGDINCHIIPKLGQVFLQKLTILQVQEFVNYLLQDGFQGNGNSRGLSAKSVRDCIGLLRQALEQAMEWGLLSRNPTKGVKIPKITRNEPQVITDGQAKEVLEALEGSYAWLPTFIAYHTGMRRGEVLALPWDSVDLDAGIIDVKRSFSLYDKNGPYFKEPKTRAGRRIVEIGSTLLKVLKTHRRKQMEAKMATGENWNNKHNLVCTKNDNSFVTPHALSEVFSYTVKKLGLNLTFHGLRHTHVSMLIKAGVPINVISARIGHSKPSITHDVYAHLLPGMGRDAVERFERLLQES